ncbi:hypothetical protein [Micromonospora tulbaghiae]
MAAELVWLAMWTEDDMTSAPTIAKIVRHYVKEHSGSRTLKDLADSLNRRGLKASRTAISAWTYGRMPSSRAKVEALREITNCRHDEYGIESISRAWTEARPQKSPDSLNMSADQRPSSAVQPDAAPVRVSRRRLAVIGGVAAVTAIVLGAAVIWVVADAGRPRLSVVDSQVVYLPAEENIASVVDVRLRNDGGSMGQLHRLTIVVEQIQRFAYRPCASGCLPRAGSQAAIVYSIPLRNAQPGQRFDRDVGITVEPTKVERMALAFADATPDTLTVARLRIALMADGRASMAPFTADVIMITGPSKGQPRHLTDRQLSLTLQDAALPVLTSGGVRAELMGRSLPVPSWLAP